MNTSYTPKTPTARFLVYDARSMGAALRQFRKEADLTQAQLAEMTGLERSYLSRLENGLETEQLRRLLALLSKLGLRLSVERPDR